MTGSSVVAVSRTCSLGIITLRRGYDMVATVFLSLLNGAWVGRLICFASLPFAMHACIIPPPSFVPWIPAFNGIRDFLSTTPLHIHAYTHFLLRNELQDALYRE
jgi:hypothetical protein